MADPSPFWLVVTNMVLGFCTIVLLMAIATSIVCELVGRIRKRRVAIRKLDSEMEQYFGRSQSHK